jgi:hypothetical protein
LQFASDYTILFLCGGKKRKRNGANFRMMSKFI